MAATAKPDVTFVKKLVDDLKKRDKELDKELILLEQQRVKLIAEQANVKAALKTLKP